MKLALVFLALAAVAAAADVSGKWSGAFRAIGGDGDTPQLFTLKQDGGRITGSGGPDAAEQYPVIDGTIAGDRVKFEVKTTQREFFYELTGKGDKLRGKILIRTGPDKRDADVWLERTR